MHVCFVVLDFAFQYLAKRLAGKNVFKMTYFVSAESVTESVKLSREWSLLMYFTDCYYMLHMAGC